MERKFTERRVGGCNGVIAEVKGINKTCPQTHVEASRRRSRYKVDTGCNLNFASYDKPLNQRIRESEDSGLAWMVIIGCIILGLIIKLII